jgi:hypothetical protein
MTGISEVDEGACLRRHAQGFGAGHRRGARQQDLPGPGTRRRPLADAHGHAALTVRYEVAGASGYTHRRFCPDAVRHTSATTATRRTTAARDETARDEKETAHDAAYMQRAGRFRRWWQVLGSNQRRLSRRFYRPRAPPESPPLTSAYALRGSIAGRGRPLCVLGSWAPGARGPRTGAGKATGAAGGSGYADRPHRS